MTSGIRNIFWRSGDVINGLNSVTELMIIALTSVMYYWTYYGNSPVVCNVIGSKLILYALNYKLQTISNLV